MIGGEEYVAIILCSQHATSFFTFVCWSVHIHIGARAVHISMDVLVFIPFA